MHNFLFGCICQPLLNEYVMLCYVMQRNQMICLEAISNLTHSDPEQTNQYTQKTYRQTHIRRWYFSISVTVTET